MAYGTAVHFDLIEGVEGMEGHVGAVRTCVARPFSRMEWCTFYPTYKSAASALSVGSGLIELELATTGGADVSGHV